jgi:hypothetical protein
MNNKRWISETLKHRIEGEDIRNSDGIGKVY